MLIKHLRTAYTAMENLLKRNDDLTEKISDVKQKMSDMKEIFELQEMYDVKT